MKFTSRITKYTWQDHKTNEDILSELKINPLVKKIQIWINKWIQHIQRMDGDRLPHSVMKYQPCGKRSQRLTLRRLLDC
jgi:hypothetical protein